MINCSFLTMIERKTFFLMALVMTLSGCVTTRSFPLCPKVAAMSFSTEDSSALVNRFMAEKAKKENITFTVLSEFIAEFKGHKYKLDRFEDRYAFMVCGFNSKLVIDDGVWYKRCIADAPRWVETVRSKQSYGLLNPENGFLGACVH